jgi:hypothetical protein
VPQIGQERTLGVLRSISFIGESRAVHHTAFNQPKRVG